MNERLLAAWHLLPAYLGEHVLLSASALTLGIAISLPLALLAIRSARIRWPLLAVASLVQTIPSIALLALFYPLLLALSALSQQMFGVGFSALGFLPSLLALTLYSILPILRNSITGVMNLDPAVIEAARGVGMTDAQRLWRVELPLAAPMIMAGVRTSAVWVIGTATLSTPVGQTSLGNYIFSGLQVENWVAVLFGCAVAALLALVVDQLLGLIEAGTVKRSTWRVSLGLGLLILGCAVAVGPRLAKDAPSYVVGAKSFSEQYILSSLLADRIREQGQPAIRKTGLGSAIAFRALAGNEIDVYVDYSGTLWANVMQRTDRPSRQIVLRTTAQWLHERYGVELLGSLGFENAYALAMRRRHAEELGIRTIRDLAAHAANLKIGGDFEFFARPEWSALRDHYGLHFAARRQFQSTFMYKAASSGEVDVISAFSSDGRIAAEDLVVLDDPDQVLLPYDAVILLSPRRADDAVLRAALEPLLGKVSIELMREANMMVDRESDKLTPAAAARWLVQQIDAKSQ
ncbi:MAG TPA: ABC transporter permease/substrate-binding protein [Povalibacter sp.]|uniref:ABC transporter permease/substrate-binding protein n=1 Tax=Povalibacter sp. TaxID=1962978 RepID=UPI002BAF1118|nr:ABC transporter permease/substrate-binding protein [Povalibacter sp.]HMN47289.1 ABC transporter permease/substrate-binding protein [Povalibacter sp.]